MAQMSPTSPTLILKETGEAFPLTGELITIGRKSGNTIVLPPDDLKSSRHHATILWQDGRYVLQDVGSINGTFLNKERLTDTRKLRDGDVIGVGSSTIIVHLPLPDTEPRSLLLGRDEPDAMETFISAPPPPAPAPAVSASDDTLIRGEPQPKFLENPYVGPRTFTQNERNRFFGRELEARELFSLVVSERLVLFYAQSGAGKSSLINTRLVPQLYEANYAVLPVGRVSGELPEGISNVKNIFIFNLLLSMDESDGDPNTFTGMSLTDFLKRLTSQDGTHYYYDPDLEPDVDVEDYEEAPYVLLIDQFEEIVTTHPARWQDRKVFFEQLAEAMENDPYLWVVLSLREDYVAALDPYSHLLPGNLRARFYMQRMGYDAALDAIEKPAEQYGRKYASGVAESLADNLRQIRVHSAQTGGGERIKTRLGQFVEPVQLQVVCYQLWENLVNRSSDEITLQDLQEMGDVDLALAQFYEQTIADVMKKTDVSEIEMRGWFESQLITEAGTRGTVYRGQHHTGGIDNEAVDLLVSKFLIRSEVRTGGTWYELVHDRFVEPILQSNHVWRLQQPLIQMAQKWDDDGRHESSLLEGQNLKEALATNWRALGPLVRNFLETSQTAQRNKEDKETAEKLEQAQTLAAERQERLEEQNQSGKKLRRRAMWITIFGIFALFMAIAAIGFAWWAIRSTQVAVSLANDAQVAQATAVQAQLSAQDEQATAVAAKETAENEKLAAEANAAEAQKLRETQQAVQEDLQKATLTAEAELSGIEVGELATRAALLEATLTVQAATLEAPTVTPSHTPVPTYTPLPTATPTGTFTPPPTETATPLPTDTATATPNADATALVQVVQAELAAISSLATRQIEATTTAESTSTECKIKPDDAFASTWEKYSSRLGCPVSEPLGGYFAEQPFENGYMFWSQILDEFIVIVGDSKGEWHQFSKEEVDSFLKSGASDCEIKAPEGLVQPISGFGAVWCSQDAIRKEIGFGTANEFGVGENLVQDFENGMMLQDSKGQIYVLFSNGTYVRE